MRQFHLTTTLAVLFCMSCATSSYQTGIRASQATGAFTHIGKQAGTEGYQVFTHPDRLHVRYNDDTEIQFVVEGPTLIMGVIVDDRKMEPPAVQTLMKKASDKGFEWIELAKRTMGGAPAIAAPPPAVQTPPAAETAAPAVATTSTCQKLFACYAQLAKDFCEESATSECQFKIEISGTDEDGCKEVLINVPALIQPLSMMKPGYTAPIICQ
jgi:hypothetical protein